MSHVPVAGIHGNPVISGLRPPLPLSTFNERDASVKLPLFYRSTVACSGPAGMAPLSAIATAKLSATNKQFSLAAARHRDRIDCPDSARAVYSSVTSQEVGASPPPSAMDFSRPLVALAYIAVNAGNGDPRTAAAMLGTVYSVTPVSGPQATRGFSGEFVYLAAPSITKLGAAATETLTHAVIASGGVVYTEESSAIAAVAAGGNMGGHNGLRLARAAIAAAGAIVATYHDAGHGVRGYLEWIAALHRYVDLSNEIDSGWAVGELLRRSDTGPVCGALSPCHAIVGCMFGPTGTHAQAALDQIGHHLLVFSALCTASDPCLSEGRPTYVTAGSHLSGINGGYTGAAAKVSVLAHTFGRFAAALAAGIESTYGLSGKESGATLLVDLVNNNGESLLLPGRDARGGYYPYVGVEPTGLLPYQGPSVTGNHAGPICAPGAGTDVKLDAVVEPGRGAPGGPMTVTVAKYSSARASLFLALFSILALAERATVRIIGGNYGQLIQAGSRFMAARGDFNAPALLSDMLPHCGGGRLPSLAEGVAGRPFALTLSVDSGGFDHNGTYRPVRLCSLAQLAGETVHLTAQGWGPGQAAHHRQCEIDYSLTDGGWALARASYPAGVAPHRPPLRFAFAGGVPQPRPGVVPPKDDPKYKKCVHRGDATEPPKKLPPQHDNCSSALAASYAWPEKRRAAPPGTAAPPSQSGTQVAAPAPPAQAAVLASPPGDADDVLPPLPPPAAPRLAQYMMESDGSDWDDAAHQAGETLVQEDAPPQGPTFTIDGVAYPGAGGGVYSPTQTAASEISTRGDCHSARSGGSYLPVPQGLRTEDMVAYLQIRQRRLKLYTLWLRPVTAEAWHAVHPSQMARTGRSLEGLSIKIDVYATLAITVESLWSRWHTRLWPDGQRHTARDHKDDLQRAYKALTKAVGSLNGATSGLSHYSLGDLLATGRFEGLPRLENGDLGPLASPVNINCGRFLPAAHASYANASLARERKYSTPGDRYTDPVTPPSAPNTAPASTASSIEQFESGVKTGDSWAGITQQDLSSGPPTPPQ